MPTALTSFLHYLSKLLFRMRPTELIVQGLTVRDFDRLAQYDGSLPYRDECVRALIWEVKYYAERQAVRIASEYLAELLLSEATETIGVPLLIPMPMHAKRRRERGHNQTEVLCEAALAILNQSSGKGIAKKVLGSSSFRDIRQTVFADSFAYAPNALIRIKHTLPQQGLERHKRLTNLTNSMRVTNPNLVEGRRCIVVDDVTTTGASFAEARRALKQAGAAEVICVALARS